MTSRAMVFRRTVLPGSETFIRNQTDYLPTWTGRIVGIERRASPLVADHDTVLFEGSPWRRRLFAWTGRSRSLTQAIRDGRFDVVHAHFSTNGWLASRAARAAGVPLVITVHAHDVTSLLNKGPWWRRAATRRQVRKALANADRVIAVSDFIRTKAISVGARPERTEVLFTGTPLAPLADVDKQWDIVFVGRMVDKKGASDLLDAIARSTVRPMRVAMIGDGELRADLEARAASLDVDVEFLGMVPPARVAQEMAAARAVVVPSKTAPNGDVEGLPTVIVEALALGVPIITTRHSGIPEAVRHEREGLLVDEGDVDALASALDRLLSDSHLAERLSEGARHRAETDFDIVAQCRKLETIYERVRDEHAQQKGRG